MTWSNLLELQYPQELGPGEADLLPIARIAVETPRVDAEEHQNVLADTLLERGLIKEHVREEVVGHPSEPHLLFANPPTPLESALAWARAKTGPTLVVPPRMLEALMADTAEGKELERIATILRLTGD